MVDGVWQSFEDDVFRAVQRAVRKGGILPFPAESSSVRRTAAYPVIKTGATIEIEISVEWYREGASEPGMIWLCECKHKVSRKVEVGDVRELHSKINELGVARTSGGIVTTVGFQEGATKLANSYGIGLYLLKKHLVPVTNYSRDGADEIREDLVVEQTFESGGARSKSRRVEECIRAAWQQFVRQACAGQAPL